MNDNDDQNVGGTALQACLQDSVTGFYRNGYCQTGPDDRGAHIDREVLKKYSIYNRPVAKVWVDILMSLKSLPKNLFYTRSWRSLASSSMTTMLLLQQV